MFNLTTYKPDLFSEDYDGGDFVMVYSKDRDAIIFALSSKENCDKFEKLTEYSLLNKTISDVLNDFRVNLVRIEMGAENIDGQGFCYCKMTISLMNIRGKCFDMIVFQNSFDGNEKKGFTWNMEYGSSYSEINKAPEFYYR